MTNSIYLSRLTPNLRSREGRRDLSNCVAMHKTLMKAFPDGLSTTGAARSEAGLLYRLEEAPNRPIALLVQSELLPDWTQLPANWNSPAQPPERKEISEALGKFGTGSILRFKLLANPTRKIGTKSGPDGSRNNGKRVELRTEPEWLQWLERKAGQCGFRLKSVKAAAHVADVQSGRDLKSTGVKNKPDGSSSRLTFCGVNFEGRLEVLDLAMFHSSLRAGVGPGKAFGYGLLSLARGD